MSIKHQTFQDVNIIQRGITWKQCKIWL